MLRSANGLVGYKINAKDGNIGKVEAFYFDFIKWVIRYLIVDVSDWLPAKHVLISPASFSGHPDWHSRIFHVGVSKEVVKGAPAIDLYKPMTLHDEFELIKYHNWPIYWEKHPQDYFPKIIMPTETKSVMSYDDIEGSHLRSTNEIAGYHMQSSDGEIGYIEDFMIDEQAWAIRYTVINAHSWLPGHKFLIAPQWFKSVNWHESKIHTDIPKEELRNGPKYAHGIPLNREFEETLHQYYGRSRYWP